MLKANPTNAICGLPNTGQMFQVTRSHGESLCCYGVGREKKLIVHFQKPLTLAELEEIVQFLRRQECLESQRV